DNRVEVGPRESLRVDRIRTAAPVWLGGEARAGRFECEVQLRAHGEVYPATVTAEDGGLTARLHKPAYGVAAGQALVVYDPDRERGDAVLCSGTIASTGAEGPRPDSASVGEDVARV